jgi:putative colanic acid biosynthesis UDP-glucose lipid carrier transferase
MKRHLLKQNATLFDAAMRVADPALVVACGVVAHRVYLGDWNFTPHYRVALVVAALLAVIIFPALGLYQSQRGLSPVEELRKLFVGWLLIVVAGGMFLFATKTGAEYSRGWVAIWLAGGLGVHALERSALRAGLRALRRRGYNLRHIVIVGAGTHGREVAARIRAAPWSGLAIAGFYDDDPALAGRCVDGIDVRGPIARCASDVVNLSADQVWIALPLHAEQALRRLIDELERTTVQVCFVPDIHGFHLLRHTVSEVAAMPVLNLTDSPHTGIASTLKAAEDHVLAWLLLIVTAPLWLLIAIGIKLSSPGPVLYRQERVTWNEERFDMLKFRTMPVGVEDESGPVWASRREPRATRFGAFLRRYSLDELPQLVNVIRGEMSIVGPRPERPEFVTQFRNRIPGYTQKHLVKAGITGWAQANDLRGDSDLAKRIQYDLYYIDNWSLWFDLRILAVTVWHILRSRNAL